MKLSVLNLVPLRAECWFGDALSSMVRLAQGVEALGYGRYWVAEHHNTRKFASSATALLVQDVLAKTSTIRVGAGGIMLPDHAPYLVAEDFGTLAALYPGRVDLGVGRAPGTDPRTAHAIRGGRDACDKFPQDVQELLGYFAGTEPVHAYPAENRDVPVCVLGASTLSAHLAATLGLPFAFAAHIAPQQMVSASVVYHAEFRPSGRLSAPYLILSMNGIVAETDAEAERLSTTQVMSCIDAMRGEQWPLQPPMGTPETVLERAVPPEGAPSHGSSASVNRDALLNQYRQALKPLMAESLIGSPDTVREQYRALRRRVEFDELMVSTLVYDEAAQLESYRLLMETLG